MELSREFKYVVFLKGGCKLLNMNVSKLIHYCALDTPSIFIFCEIHDKPASNHSELKSALLLRYSVHDLWVVVIVICGMPRLDFIVNDRLIPLPLGYHQVCEGLLS